jgi:hypothetical protein
MRYLLLVGVLIGGCNSSGLSQPACGGDSETCCAATAEEAAQLPAPPKGIQGQGRCNDGLACAQGACPPRSTCNDGSFNESKQTEYIAYCVPLATK